MYKLVSCGKNRWGGWLKSWFYVNLGEDMADLPQSPNSSMVPHAFVAFPNFEVREQDQDEAALHHARVKSSDRDLVEEFIAHGVWPLRGGWAIKEIAWWKMPLKSVILRREIMGTSHAFTIDLLIQLIWTLHLQYARLEPMLMLIKRWLVHSGVLSS
jgi:hypothetical protein